MQTVFLNDQFLPMSEAKISPMDRGFLFGDGIYEVIPSYDGKMPGFSLHIQRLQRGLQALAIELEWSLHDWQAMCETLLAKNDKGNLSLYLQVSRGADITRNHAYPDDVSPTVFAFTMQSAPPPVADKKQVKGLKALTTEDLRWQRCHIKSTSLLGNVMHYQQGKTAGAHETILFNKKQQLTEASASNVFIVQQGRVSTPPLDNQILPGVTRHMLLDMLRKSGLMTVEERIISIDEVREADEIWLTSSGKEVAPVIELDGQPVGDGQVGDAWLQAQSLYTAHKYDY